MILSLGQHALLQNVSVMKMLRLVEMQVTILTNITGQIPKSHQNGVPYIDQNTHILVQVNRTVNNRMFLYKNIAASLSCKVSGFSFYKN